MKLSRSCLIVREWWIMWFSISDGVIFGNCSSNHLLARVAFAPVNNSEYWPGSRFGKVVLYEDNSLDELI